MRIASMVSFLMLLALPAFAQDVFHTSLGVNGVWFAGDLDLPADFELGATGSASLSPHISAVGGGFYGFNRSYLRGYVGGRITATDANDPNFSIGLGAAFHVSSEEDIRPQEWASDVTIGWKPFPEKMQRVTVGAQSWYGFDSHQVGILVAARYALKMF